MHVCKHVSMYVCMYSCMHVCMHACMYVCIMHVCMYCKQNWVQGNIGCAPGAPPLDPVTWQSDFMNIPSCLAKESCRMRLIDKHQGFVFICQITYLPGKTQCICSMFLLLFIHLFYNLHMVFNKCGNHSTTMSSQPGPITS